MDLEKFRREYYYVVPIIANRIKRDEEKVKKYIELAIILQSAIGNEVYTAYYLYYIYEELGDIDLGIPIVLAIINHRDVWKARGLRSVTAYNTLKVFEVKEDLRRMIENNLREINIPMEIVMKILNNVEPIQIRKLFSNLSLVHPEVYSLFLGVFTSIEEGNEG
ncbi:HD domain-containing protein [Saccharolobus shibatae]|uniref:Uncharacterized protein n=1 Tax=Saccharolobus shibatae TaxID=2286 RepID=A0A8F5BW60_9CREN|nr:hypothetical protein [Saccharolobus shibatae]QXJ32438.1 hypothetical protein J5U21_02089 [Saccharolobus shibatae]